MKYRDNSEGNLVNWSQSIWDETGVNSKDEPMESICQRSATLDALLPRQGGQMAKFDPHFCLDYVGAEFGGAIKEKDGIKFCSVA